MLLSTRRGTDDAAVAMHAAVFIFRGIVTFLIGIARHGVCAGLLCWNDSLAMDSRHTLSMADGETAPESATDELDEAQSFPRHCMRAGVAIAKHLA